MAVLRSVTSTEPGLTPSEALEVFNHMERFASYGFNKSHAAAYAAIGFQTAWLKRHHPEAFFSASMNLAMGTVKDIAVFAGQLKNRKVPLLAPNINLCGARFAPMRGRTRVGVAYGLGAIRGVGMADALAIEASRTENGRFVSVDDFKARLTGVVGKKAMSALVQAGAFDSLCDVRADAAAIVEEKAMAGGTAQMSLFDVAPAFGARETVPEWDRADLLDKEFDALGFWLSGHPLEGFQRVAGPKPITLVGALRGRTDMPRQATIAASVIDFDTRGTKSGGVMGIITLSDATETFEAIAFDDGWFAVRDLVKKKATLALQVSPMAEEGELRLLVNGAERFAPAQARRAA